MLYLTGTEISVTFIGRTVHIVGLGFDAERDLILLARELGVLQTNGNHLYFEDLYLGPGVDKASQVLKQSPPLVSKIANKCF
jgi:hypothetical protein